MRIPRYAVGGSIAIGWIASMAIAVIIFDQFVDKSGGDGPALKPGNCKTAEKLATDAVLTSDTFYSALLRENDSLADLVEVKKDSIDNLLKSVYRANQSTQSANGTISSLRRQLRACQGG